MGNLAVLKYKPTVLTTARVTGAPQHSHHQRRRAGDPSGHRLPGYVVTLEWWDPLRGQWSRLRPYVLPMDPVLAPPPGPFAAWVPVPGAIVSLLVEDQRVFFTFVMYARVSSEEPTRPTTRVPPGQSTHM